MICLVSFGVFLFTVIVFVIYPSALQFSRALTMDGFRRQMELRFAWLSFLGGMTVASAAGSGLLGILSVFQSNLTKLKRIVLLIVCLLPAVFALPGLVLAFSELGWHVIGVAALVCTPGWIINGPAILTGRPLFQVMWQTMCKLRLVSGDYPERW